MNEYDKGKLKVLIKMILIQKSPNRLTANQLCEIINMYDWGFRISITSRRLAQFLYSELTYNNFENHFMNCIKKSKKNKIWEYYYEK